MLLWGSVLCYEAYGQYEYIYPSSGARNEMPQTQLIMRHGALMDPSSVRSDRVSIWGKKSGVVPARVVLSTDGVTICIQPLKAFAWSDTVFVQVAAGFRTMEGTVLRDTSWSFHVRRPMTEYEQQILEEYLAQFDAGGYLINDPDRQSTYVPAPAATRGSQLPYVLIFTNNNPAPGYVFFSRNSGTSPITSDQRGYGIITSAGDSVFHRSSSSDGSNFQLNKHGMYTAYRMNKGVDTTVLILDAAFNIVGDVPCKNGLRASQHEHLFLPDGSKYFTIYDWQPGWDLSNYGGSPSAVVNVSWIQKLDAAGNITFQWRSDQHFVITDATSDISLSTQTVDPWHINSIDVDNDGNLIAGFRNMDRVVKIKSSNGAVLWHWGGPKSAYTDILTYNDPDGGFSHQHMVHRLPNGNILMFDNGNLHAPPVSKPKEYVLDEVNKTATCVWYYTHPQVNGFNMYTKNQGSAQRLPNGNTLIGYGLPNVQGLPNGTEIDPNKNIVWEFRFRDSTEYSYRLYKSDLMTGIHTPVTELQVTVFPNPASDWVQIFLTPGAEGPARIVLYDLSGKQLAQQDQLYGRTVHWNVQDLAPGMYFFEIATNRGATRRSFLKQ